MRLVPNQKPDKILKYAERYLKKLAPGTVRLECTPGHSAEPYLIEPTGGVVKAALKVLKETFGREPLLLREGGSIPIVNDFKSVLGVDTLLVGLALPDDNAHSPNEKFDLQMFAKGMEMSVRLWHELGNIGRS